MLKYVQVHRVKEPMTLSTLSSIVFKFKLSLLLAMRAEGQYGLLIHSAPRKPLSQ